jgi:SAM-dependent methyltransferase
VSDHPPTQPTPAQRWADALEAWAIPAHILDQAPEDPWVHPPAFFAVNPSTDPRDTPSHRIARRALGTEGGTVLDVGVGGGRSCLPLVPLANELNGVDEQQAMLDLFQRACADARVRCRTFLGRWPDVTVANREVHIVDVAVCHHVVYNVADIEPFLRALNAYARRAVVIELPERHPTSWMNPMWERFWSLSRPSEPSAGLFESVVRSLGWLPEVAWAERPPRTGAQAHSQEFVAFCRRRLCLPASRDGEVADALGELGTTAIHRVATVAWRPA